MKTVDAEHAASPLERYAQRTVDQMPRLLRVIRERLPTTAAACPAFEKLGPADRITVMALLEDDAQWQPPLQAALESTIRSSLSKRRVVLAAAAPEAPTPELRSLDDLRLKDEHEIELDMETARIEQQLEAVAERPLRELRALCSTLRGETAVTQDSPALHPKACASALARGVSRLALSPAGRVACLQRLAAAAVEPLHAFYDEQVRSLLEQGVQPAGFRVLPGTNARARPTGVGGSAAEPGAQALPIEARIGAALERLVLRAQAEVGLSPGPGQRQVQPSPPGLGEPAPVALAAALTELPVDLADRLMGELLQSLGGDDGMAATTQAVFNRLEVPGQRLARHDPGIWFQSSHPWWLLLDRLLSLCEVLADGPAGGQAALMQRFDPMLRRLAEAEVPDAALCQGALDELVTQSTADLVSQHGDAAVASADSASAADDEPASLASVLRDQMALQLRTSTAPAGLRRFLLGPWVDVLVAAMDGRTDDAAMQRCSGLVDELLELLAAPADAPEQTTERLAQLLDQVRAGLETLAMPADQIEGWLADLTTRLAEASAIAPSVPDQDEGWRHEDLPTVPVGLHDALQTARARRDREAWLVNLQVGDICRIFLDNHWQTLRLTDIDKASQRYVMQGRERGGRPQTLTRQALEQLRSEGLTTTIEPGAFLTKAVETLNASMRPLGRLRGSGPGPGGRKP
ncbi:MAG: DUF1631 family protein [Burkholderiales bacterium]